MSRKDNRFDSDQTETADGELTFDHVVGGVTRFKPGDRVARVRLGGTEIHGRGIVVKVDLSCAVPEFYDGSNLTKQVITDQPFYSLYVEDDDMDYYSYVGEHAVIADESPEVLRHRAVALAFDLMPDGSYVPRQRTTEMEHAIAAEKLLADMKQAVRNPWQPKKGAAKFNIGDVLWAPSSQRRGVVIRLFPETIASDEWHQNAPVPIPKNQPFYTLLMDGEARGDYETFPEQFLEQDISGQPVNHPDVDELFGHHEGNRYFVWDNFRDRVFTRDVPEPRFGVGDLVRIPAWNNNLGMIQRVHRVYQKPGDGWTEKLTADGSKQAYYYVLCKDESNADSFPYAAEDYLVPDTSNDVFEHEHFEIFFEPDGKGGYRQRPENPE